MSRWWNKRRFDLAEVCVVAGLLGIAGWSMVDRLTIHPEAAWLQSTYGPERNSQHSEEWIVRDFFEDKRDGFFVDVGANDYRMFSNTYYLETALGWSGIAVEPLLQFEAGYREHRPRTRFFPFFVSDGSNSEVKLYLLEELPLVASGDKTFTER